VAAHNISCSRIAPLVIRLRLHSTALAKPAWCKQRQHMHSSRCWARCSCGRAGADEDTALLLLCQNQALLKIRTAGPTHKA
jgi:hypothetical protein